MERYQSAAGAYERSRPGYPDRAIEHLVEVLDIGADSTVLDLAAGTGKLTRLVAPFAGSMVAVEPVAGMRTVLGEQLPAIKILDGSAESIPLDDQSVDVVTVGQAFHWFDGTAALSEIHRVLKRGGCLGVVFNLRDLTTPEQAGLESILAPTRGNKSRHRTGEWELAFGHPDSGFSPLHSKMFELEHRVDRHQLVDLVRSITHMTERTGAEWSATESGIDELFDRVSDPTGRVRLRYETQVFWSETVARSDRVR